MALLINDIQKDIYYNKCFDLLPALTTHANRLDTFHIDDSLALRKVYARLANCWRRAGDLYQAKLLYDKAHNSISATIREADPWVFYVENPLAIIETKLGNYERAIALYKLSIETLSNLKDHKKAIRTLNNLAIVYHSQTEYQLAVDTYLESQQQAKAINFGDGLRKAQIGIVPSLLKLGDTKNAKVYIDEVATVDTLDLHSKVYQSNNTIDYYSEIGNYESALHESSNNFAILDSLYTNKRLREFAKHHIKAATIQHKLGKNEEAKTSVLLGLQSLLDNPSEVLVPDSVIYAENSFAELFELYGDIHVDIYHANKSQEDLHISLESYLRAAKVYKLLRREYVMLGSKFLSVREATSLRNKGFDILTLLTDDRQKLRYAVELITLTKNTILDDQLTKKQNEKQLSANDLSVLLSNRQELTLLKKESTNELKQILLAEQNNNILESVPHKNEQSYNGNLVEYVLTDHNLFAISNFSNGRRLSHLATSKEIDKIIEQYYKQLNNISNISSIHGTLENLYNILLQPLGKLPKTFSVITDAKIAIVSFDLLRKDNKYLLEDHVVDYRLSKRLISQHRSKSKVSIVCPDYSSTDQIESHQRLAVYPLKYAREEAANIAELYGGEVTNNISHENELIQLIEQSDILHFSGHAQPLDDGSLVLDGSHGKAKVTISGTELASVSSNLRLAILSACETGLGELKSGEGMLSLTRAFVEGGTPSIVNSLWTVNDQTTAELMTLFHQQLISGTSIDQSLRNAKLQYLSTHTGEDLHPYYWGGFIHTTATDLNNHSTPNNCNLSLILLLTGLAVVSLLIFKKQK